MNMTESEAEKRSEIDALIRTCMERLALAEPAEVPTADPADPGSLSALLSCLLRNDCTPEAEALMAYLAENGEPGDPTVGYCRMVGFLRQEDGDKTPEAYDGILAVAADAAAKLDSGAFGTPDWFGPFYFTYALLQAKRQEFDEIDPLEPLTALLDRGLAVVPDDILCLDYKGWLLQNNGLEDEALEVYRKLEQHPGHDHSVEAHLAELYYHSLREHAEEALHYYRLLIGREPENPENYFYAGMCLYRLERPEEAEACFREELEYRPEDADGYYRLANTLLKLNRPEDALAPAQKAISLVGDQKHSTVFLRMPLINAYRCLHRTEKAVSAVRDCKKCNPGWEHHRLLFDIYVQEGKFREARRSLRRWRWDMKGKISPEWATAQARLYLLTQQFGKLRFHLGNCMAAIDPLELRRAKMLLALQKNDLNGYLSISEDTYLRLTADNEEVSPYQQGRYALALFAGGRYGKSRETAAAILETLDQKLTQATGCRRLDRCERSLMLALLGNETAAKKAAAEAEQTPMCDGCEFCACKDLDVCRCETEFIFGHWDKAMELALSFAEKWPGEPDFLEMQYLIRAKAN